MPKKSIIALMLITLIGLSFALSGCSNNNAHAKWSTKLAMELLQKKFPKVHIIKNYFGNCKRHGINHAICVYSVMYNYNFIYNVYAYYGHSRRDGWSIYKMNGVEMTPRSKAWAIKYYGKPKNKQDSEILNSGAFN